jgi:beta-galactosidase
VTVDVVPPGTDLTGYRLVLVPTLYLCTDRTVADVTAAVSAGVHALVTYFSGIVDEHDHIRLGGYPGAFRDLLGLRVEEFHPLLEGQVVSLAGDFVEDATATCWSEPVDCVEADPVLRYVDGPVPGHAAVTRRALGNATVWYVASRLDGHTRHRLLSRVCDEAGVSPATRTVPGVEVARRVDGNRSWLFVINHTREEAELSDVHGHDLVGDRPVAGRKLAPGAVAVVREAEVG